MILYTTRLGADSLSGLFGIYWPDEGIYLLSAKNQALFGVPHFFEGDRWRPELMVPLLHFVATFVARSAPENLTVAMRSIACIAVLSSQLLLVRTCHRLHRDPQRSMTCWILLLLNPVLFFYARCGLSEGLQLLVLTLGIVSLERFQAASQSRERMVWTTFSGLFCGFLLLSKLSSIGGVVALAIGFLYIALRNSQGFRQALKPIFGFAIAAIVPNAIYSDLAILPQIDSWIWSNIKTQGHRIDLSPAELLRQVLGRFIFVAQFYVWMPILYFYAIVFWKGCERADPRTYPFHLATLGAILTEIVFGYEVRRNFFGIALISFSVGMMFSDLITPSDMRSSLARSRLAILLLALVLANTAGLSIYLITALKYGDWTYSLLCVYSLAISLLLIYSIAKRTTALTKLAFAFSVIPSGVAFIAQSLTMPYTRLDMIRLIEEKIPVDTTVVGSSAPWYVLDAKRRFVFANCTYANEINSVPVQPLMYSHGGDWDVCRVPPGDWDIEIVEFFNVVNDPLWPGQWKFGQSALNLKTSFYLMKQSE